VWPATFARVKGLRYGINHRVVAIRNAPLSVTIDENERQAIVRHAVGRYERTLDSLYANTSIKFAGGVGDKDAYALARNMRCEPAFIAGQPRGSFAAFIRACSSDRLTTPRRPPR
jgi:hypothetical protein